MLQRKCEYLLSSTHFQVLTQISSIYFPVWYIKKYMASYAGLYLASAKGLDLQSWFTLAVCVKKLIEFARVLSFFGWQLLENIKIPPSKFPILYNFLIQGGITSFLERRTGRQTHRRRTVLCLPYEVWVYLTSNFISFSSSRKNTLTMN